MFMGEYNHTIDAKGRLIIPSKFRELLGEEFVLTKGLDGCLSIYPMDEWNAFEEKLRALPLTNKNARTFTRFFVAGATNCELDKQGRILVPQTLREFAGLEKDVILAGNLSRVEVWSKEKWSVNPATGDVDATTIEGQTEQVIANIAAVLEEAGSSFDNVVKTTCFLADIADFGAFNGVYEKYFTSKPARSCVAVKDLPKAVLVEIEILAVVE